MAPPPGFELELTPIGVGDPLERVLAAQTANRIGVAAKPGDLDVQRERAVLAQVDLASEAHQRPSAASTSGNPSRSSSNDSNALESVLRSSGSVTRSTQVSCSSCLGIEALRAAHAR